jgi:hypothetical protein
MSAVKVIYTLSDEELNSSIQRTMVLCPGDDIESGVRGGDVERSRWNSRGWTMQERSLSARLVHFCRNKLYFECRSTLKSEENEPERAEALSLFRMWLGDKNQQDKKHHSSTSASPLGTDPISAVNLYGWWRRMVVEYSFRNLTHSSDKLRAIQSLAAEMASSVDDEYIQFAGMWKRNLNRELLWYVERGTRVRPPYRAPSWSWASLDVRVGFVIGSRSTSSIDAVETRLLRDPFQLIDFGKNHPDPGSSLRNYLKIKALTKHVSRIAEVADEGDYWERVDRWSFPYTIFVETKRADGTTTDTVFAHVLLDLDNKDNLLLATESLLYAHVSNEQFPSGLILQCRDSCSDGDGEEVWTRVGVATIFHKTGEPILDPPFDQREKAVALTIV